MASLIQRLSHSFMTTLFYIWTVIHALLSFRSPVPFPFRETSAVVPSTVEIDLERGLTVKRERCAYPMPAPSLAFSIPETSHDVIQKAADNEYSRQQNTLKFSPGFSSKSSPGRFSEYDTEFTSIDLSASIEKVPLHGSESPDPPKKTIEEATSNDFDLSLAGDLMIDPFLDVKPISPLVTYFSKDGYGMEDVDPLLFTLPLCTSTPPRSQRGGKGHRRGALATLIKPEHINIPKSSAELDSLPSLTETESVVDTPSAQRQRTASLRRSVVSGIFDSPPPAWSTPKKFAPYIVVLGSTPESSSSSEPIFRPTTPLRIVKRKKIRSSTTSEVSKAVISAVRDAFVETREEHDNDAAADPRDLLSRASVWTCNTLPVSCSKSDISVYEDDSEDGDTQESSEQEPATPPPPYAFSNPNITGTVADGLKADTVEAFLGMKRYSVSSNGSTELGYLAATPGSVPASVDSCLDDILASFENLMAVMPELHTPAAKAQAAKLQSPTENRRVLLPI